MSTQIIKCYIDKIVYESKGLCVCKAITDDERYLQVVIKDRVTDIKIKKGDCYKVEGVEISNKQYGVQIIAKNICQNNPSTSNLVSFLINSRIFRGIGLGKKKVFSLYDNYGNDLIAILDSGEWKKLVQDNGFNLISEPIAKSLCEKWSEYSEITNVISFIACHGITGRAAYLIQNRYKKNTIKVLSEDPYKLLAFLEPTVKNWEMVERASKKLGVTKKDDIRRLVGATEMAIYECHGNGDTAFTRDTLTKKVTRYIGCSLVEQAIKESIGEGLLVESEGLFQHRGVSKLEERVGDKLYSLINHENQQSSLFYNQVTEEDVDIYFDKHDENSCWTFNDKQKQSIKNAFFNNVSVVIGGAGVGKTSAIKAIGDIATNKNINFYQIALAGRAAKRMQEATGYASRTIASFLSSVSNGTITLYDGDYIIIDESSMVSLSDVFRLLRAIQTHVHLVFVGDDFQLPPISFGEVFSVLSNDKNIVKVELTEVYRQEDKTGIPSIAKTIRSGKVPSLKNYSSNKEGVFFIECPEKELNDKILDVYHDSAQMGDVQILSMTNTGAGGVTKVNDHIQSVINSMVENNRDIFVGDKIIYLVNDYEKELFNGSLGEVKSIEHSDDGDVLVVLWDDGVTRCIDKQLYKIYYQLAFSITVHKAQGSQFESVVVPIRKGRNLDNRMLYTALTRAVKQVVFIGSWAAFNDAVVADPKSYTRLVGLKIRPSESLEKGYKIAS